MADLSSFSDEELDALERKLEERERLGNTYRKVKRAEDTTRLMEGAGNLAAEGARARAIARLPPQSPLIGALDEKMAPRTPEEADEVSRRASDAGAKVTAPAGAPVSTDIEGALRKGGREIIAGDQRLVVTPGDQANPMATRAEAPPLTKHVKALLDLDDTPESNDPSILGVLGNTLTAPARAAATAVNIGSEVARGGDLDASAIPGELLRALNNEGNVREGGRVATAGGGFGDVLRRRRDILLKENPNATLDDLLGAWDDNELVLGPIRAALAKSAEVISGADPAVIERDELAGLNPATPLAQLSDDAVDNYGTFVSLFLDPLNVVPFEKIPLLASKAARAVGAAPVADAVDAARAFATKPRALPFFSSRGERTAAAMTDDVGAAVAREAGDVVDDAARRAAAERQTANTRAAQTFEGALKDVTYDEAQQAIRAIEGVDGAAIEVRPWDEQRAVLQSAAQRSGDRLATADQQAIAQALTSPTARDFVEANAFRLGRELGVVDQLFRPHALDAAAPKVASTAKRLKSIAEEFREQLQATGHLEGVTSTTGYLPHVPKAALVTAMQKRFPGAAGFIERNLERALPSPDFDPLKRRTMSAVVDAQNVRAATQDAVDAGFVGAGAGDVRAAARDPQLGANPQLRDNARAALGGAPPAQQANVPSSSSQLAARGRDNVAFSTNPERVFGTYGNAVNPAIMAARMGQILSEATLSNGMKLVDTVRDAVARDPALATKFLDQQGFRLPAFEVGPNGTPQLHGDIVRSLDQRGLTFVAKTDELAQRIPSLGNSVMPKVVVREMEDVLARVSPGSIEKWAGKLMGPFNRLWIPVVLNTPGFHVRNAIFGAFQTYLALGDQAFNPRLFRAAQRVADAASTGRGLDEVIDLGGRQTRVADIVKLAEANGVYEGGRVADLRRAMAGRANYSTGNKALDVAKAVTQIANPWSPRTLTKQGPAFETLASRIPAGLGAGRLSTGATMENVQRLQVFLHELAIGRTPGQAATQVMKFLFDYTGSNLSRAERTLRQIFPFYQWIRYSAQQMVGQVLRQPEKYAQVNRLYEMLDRAGRDRNYDPREIPGYVRDQGLVSSPFSTDDAESARFVGYERPGTQLAGAMNLTAGLSPLARMVVEANTGKYVYGDQPIDPNYDPELEWRGPMDAAGALVNISGDRAPAYYSGIVGGVPGFIATSLLSAAGEDVGGSRRSGQAAEQKMADRIVTMAGGPRRTTVRPADTRAGTQRTGADAQGKSDKRASRREQAELAPNPLGAMLRRIFSEEP